MTIKPKSALPFIFITVFVDVMGIGLIIPILPELIAQLTGTEVVVDDAMSIASGYGAWLMFSYALMQFIFSPILGGLSDRFGRRPILLISLLGLGIDYIFHALAPSIAWLFVGRVIAGICGASYTTATAYIADISTPEKRAQNFGLVGVAFGLGFIFGPSLGGFIGEAFGLRTPFYVAAALSLLNALYGYFILPESLPANNRRAFDFKRSNPVGSLLNIKRFPVLYGLMASFILIYLAAHAVQSNWTFYTMHRFKWSKTDVGLSLTVVGVLVAAVQGGLIRIIVPKLGQTRAVFVGFILYSLGLFMFGLANQSWMMYAFLVPYCLGGIAGPTLQGIISGQVPQNEQGELQGTLTSLMSATAIFGPLLMNGLFSYFTSSASPIQFPGAAFILGGILTVISTILLIKPLRKFKAASIAAKNQE